MCYPNAADKATLAEKQQVATFSFMAANGQLVAWPWATNRSEMFVLAHDVDLKHCVPCNHMPNFKKQPAWLRDLYRELRTEMSRYPI
jgi:hypothetical protein